MLLSHCPIEWMESKAFCNFWEVDEECFAFLQEVDSIPGSDCVAVWEDLNSTIGTVQQKHNSAMHKDKR